MSWQPFGIWPGENAISSSKPKSPSGVGGCTPDLGVLGVKQGIFGCVEVTGVVGQVESTGSVSIGTGEESRGCSKGAGRCWIGDDIKQ